MESENWSTSNSLVKCCDCGCSCSMWNRTNLGSFTRSNKRKIDEAVEENVFTIPGLVIPQNARVEIENECTALREALVSQQQTIQDLILELEEERNASSSAANEAMSMILRLQSEKAEVQMESRQFKRFVDEKIAHDQEEMLGLEDLLYKREQRIQSLACEVQAYKHRMLSYGLTENEADVGDGEKSLSRNTSMVSNQEGQFDFLPYDIYPPLRCDINKTRSYPDVDDETADIEKYAFGETPCPQHRLKDLEHRINELEKIPRTIQPEEEYFGMKNMLEKVIVDQSPRQSRHFRKHSIDSMNSYFAMDKEMGQDFTMDSPKYGTSLDVNSNLRKMDNSSDIGDDMSDRVYTIDSIHQGASINDVMNQKAAGVDCYEDTRSPIDSPKHSEVRDLEVQKLYARLQALEADRESMRQSIISFGTDKAQLILLKEIAENLCKDMVPTRAKPLQKQSAARSLSVKTLFKFVVSFVFWRRKARRCKYMFGLSTKNEGLLLLLDRGPRVGQWRNVSTTNMSMSY